jgi:hypothetical protein
VQADYERAESGELRGPLPAHCSLGEDGSECKVGFHGTRTRKTGPCIPLTVAKCHRHKRAFTVYPPAFVPYGRAAIIPVDLEGRRVRSEADYIDGGALANTVWEAIVDAAQGKRWAESGDARGSRRTQGRRLKLGADLFGLESTARQRERLAFVVGVPTITLHEVAKEYSEKLSWKARGQALLKLVSRSFSHTLPETLFEAGRLAELWGRSMRWDPGG